MKIIILIITVLCSLLVQAGSYVSDSEIVIVKLGFNHDHISQEWKEALMSRMSARQLDSVLLLKRLPTREELDWIKLIESKAFRWNSFRDSLEIPFKNIGVPDTVFVMLGFSGVDDGFTYQFNTVCFDLTALQSNYGYALRAENSERMDRLFAHEYTHLIHKAWAMKTNLKLRNFKDSILWECLYEGMGMYRSLSAKWYPNKGELPSMTVNTLKELSSVFVDRLSMLHSKDSFSTEERTRIHSNLSRGPVNKKWGAFTVAIWLIQESKGDDRKLIPWMERGSDAILLLAEKYLEGDNKRNFLSGVIGR